MEPQYLFSAISKDQEVLRWILVIVGAIFLIFGAGMYYSAIRLFGSVIGAIVAIVICYNVTLNGQITGLSLTLLFLFCGIVGALMGNTLALVFHHAIFFIAGAIIGIVIFRMFGQGLVSPDMFYSMTWDDFMQTVVPKESMDIFVMVIGGIVYMVSSHFLIVMTMALVGSFIIAYSLGIYYLFPFLAVFGGLIQYKISKPQKLKLTIKKKKKVSKSDD